MKGYHSSIHGRYGTGLQDDYLTSYSSLLKLKFLSLRTPHFLYYATAAFEALKMGDGFTNYLIDVVRFTRSLVLAGRFVEQMLAPSVKRVGQ